jgi:hypothetical protein
VFGGKLPADTAFLLVRKFQQVFVPNSHATSSFANHWNSSVRNPLVDGSQIYRKELGCFWSCDEDGLKRRWVYCHDYYLFFTSRVSATYSSHFGRNELFSVHSNDGKPLILRSLQSKKKLLLAIRECVSRMEFVYLNRF